jgi:tRNA threonylcarbamoyl adenosine modification protein (Sua5/YciO/YrdC/YwlC family)
MSKFIQLESSRPNPRVLKELTRENIVFAYPGETGYCLACSIHDQKALEKITNMKDLSKNHNFTICCSDIKTAAIYAIVDNKAFKFIKNHSPSAITFILPATNLAPKKLSNKKRKTLGIRIPNAILDQTILNLFDGAFITTSCINDQTNKEEYISAENINTAFYGKIDYIIETEARVVNPSTIVDCSLHTYNIIRKGSDSVNL